MKTIVVSKQLIEQIAAEKNRTAAIKRAGITKSAFYLHAHEYGVDFRRDNSPYKLTEDDRKLICQLVQETDLSLRVIGSKFEVSHTTVKRCVEKYHA